MMRRLMGLLAAAAVVGVGASAGTFNTLPQRQIPPGSLKPICKPDPAVISITLAKQPLPAGMHRVGMITLTYLVKNLGSQWHDDGGRAGKATLTTQNGTGTVNSVGLAFPRDAGPGAVMLSPPPYRVPGSFGADEFVGYIDVSLAYDPDDASDGNPCNDDNNVRNNTFRISGAALTDFLTGTPLTRTFANPQAGSLIIRP